MKKYKILIIIMILIGLSVTYYYYLSTNSKKSDKKKNKTASEIEKLINEDFDNDYPSTPREVVDGFSRILKCYYEGKYSDDEFMSLVLQSRKLFDEELLNRNSLDEYISNLKAEIEQYKSEGKKISTYIIEESGDIEFKTFQSHYYSMVDCVYYMKSKNGTYRTMETYTLRKDSEGKWKILYWALTDDKNENE